MAPTFAFLLLVGLFETTMGHYCHSYTNENGTFKPGVDCYFDYCCGNCGNRFCCSVSFIKITDDEQNFCDTNVIGVTLIASVVFLSVFFSLLVTCCCCCECCCLYRMCRKLRPVAGPHATSLVNTQRIQQLADGQYPDYQPLINEPAYDAQPVQAGAHPAQPFAPGPPQPYHSAMNPGYPTDQAQYGCGPANLPLETLKQLAYNPAYIEPPKASY